MTLATKCLLSGACAAALVLVLGGGTAAQTNREWPPARWPSSLDNPRVQQALIKTDYTAEERRNIMTVLTELSDEARPAWLKDPNRQPHQGFPGLEKYYGSLDYDAATSIPDRKDRIIDIIAKANRVWGAYTINGHHQGSIFGFKGDGKPLQILQFFYRTFDGQGRTVENIFRAEELQLYVALGGKIGFPRDGIAAQIGAGPHVRPGAAAEPAAAGRGAGRGAGPTFWTSWPPPQWPTGVRNQKLIAWLTEAPWTDEEKRALQPALQSQFDAGDPTRPADFTVRFACGISCPQGRRGFDFIDELAGFHGYYAPLSSRDRFNETEDIIAKGNRVWRVFRWRGHQTGYLYGFPGDGHPIEAVEMSFGGGGPAGGNGLGIRAEELQFYVSMGGKLQFPGKQPLP